MRGLWGTLLFAGISFSQAPAQAPPESPDPSETVSAKQQIPPPESRGDTHIFGVVPNYNAVNDPSHPFEPIGVR
ncbi:MAG TPA: hypothetical protein VKS01_10680, partial [Bryobacteraceae bacterium]|nr:hypothetical protein [Bryobacteraceae bacterium]